jgi:transposase
MEDTIGIDISKDTLDAYWLSSREHRQFCNDKAGAYARLISRHGPRC